MRLRFGGSRSRRHARWARVGRMRRRQRQLERHDGAGWDHRTGDERRRELGEHVGSHRQRARRGQVRLRRAGRDQGRRDPGHVEQHGRGTPRARLREGGRRHDGPAVRRRRAGSRRCPDPRLCGGCARVGSGASRRERRAPRRSASTRARTSTSARSATTPSAHYTAGMLGEVTVKGAANTDPLPQTTAEVDASEYKFDVNGLKAGDNTLTFANKGNQFHHLVAVPLTEGATLDDVKTFLGTAARPRAASDNAADRLQQGARPRRHRPRPGAGRVADARQGLVRLPLLHQRQDGRTAPLHQGHAPASRHRLDVAPAPAEPHVVEVPDRGRGGSSGERQMTRFRSGGRWRGR